MCQLPSRLCHLLGAIVQPMLDMLARASRSHERALSPDVYEDPIL